MSGMTPGFAELKKGMKATWMAGDFGQIARNNEREGEEFVARLELHSGMRVLDVACGTGNQSIPAARTGADVTGLDIATNLLEQARNRAEAERTQGAVHRRRRRAVAGRGDAVRCGLLDVRGNVCAPARDGCFRVGEGLPAGRVDCDGELDP